MMLDTKFAIRRLDSGRSSQGFGRSVISKLRNFAHRIGISPNTHVDPRSACIRRLYFVHLLATSSLLAKDMDSEFLNLQDDLPASCTNGIVVFTANQHPGTFL